MDELELYKLAFDNAVGSYIGALDSWEHECAVFQAKKKGLSVFDYEKREFLAGAKKELKRKRK